MLRIHMPRILLALIFILAGFNGWVVILGYDPVFPTSPKAMELLTGYLLVLEKSTELLGGLLLLFNIFTPAILAIFAPIVVNIFLFHIFEDPALPPLAIVVSGLEGYLLWIYRDHYKGLLERKGKLPM